MWHFRASSLARRAICHFCKALQIHRGLFRSRSFESIHRLSISTLEVQIPTLDFFPPGMISSLCLSLSLLSLTTDVCESLDSFHKDTETQSQQKDTIDESPQDFSSLPTIGISRIRSRVFVWRELFWRGRENERNTILSDEMCQLSLKNEL